MKQTTTDLNSTQIVSLSTSWKKQFEQLNELTSAYSQTNVPQEVKNQLEFCVQQTPKILDDILTVTKSADYIRDNM